MTKAQKRARQVLRKYNLTTAPTDLKIIIDGEELILDEWSFHGRVKEVYLGDSIGVDRNADPQKQRELIAHALGHHFLHTGNHLYFERHDQFTTFKQEHEAQCFAAELLFPRAVLKKVKHLSTKEIANFFSVPEDFTQFGMDVVLKGGLCH
jgi:Zn-dependent peptidase ImmA (M78 family)